LAYKIQTPGNYPEESIQHYFSFYLAQQPPVGQGLLIHEVSRSHNDAPQSVELL